MLFPTFAHELQLGGTLRQELSARTPLILRIINLISFLLFSLIAIFSLLLGRVLFIPIAIVFLNIGFFVFSRSLAQIWIDEDHIYVKKYSNEIRVDPANIEDVDFWRLSKYLVLRFKTPTKFGSSILFEPTGGSGAMDAHLRGEEAFEGIGKLCGWRK